MFGIEHFIRINPDEQDRLYRQGKGEFSSRRYELFKYHIKHIIKLKKVKHWNNIKKAEACLWYRTPVDIQKIT